MGRLVKVLADNSATVVTPGGATVTACTIHTDQAGNPDGRVWVGCADGAISLSRGHGEAGTWEAKAPAPNGARVNYIQESFFAEGQMEMLAGPTYYTSFSAAGDWVAAYTHPNAALTAYRFAAGFGQGWIGFSGPNNGLDAGAPRLRERTTAVDIGPPGGAVLSVVGLCFDVYEEMLYVADNDPSTGHGRLWRAPTATSGNLEALAYDYATYGPIRHMIRDGSMPGLLYIAAQHALLKSPDGLETIQVMRTLAGGREGMMIGYGAERALALLFTLASTVGAERALNLWDGASNDAAPAGWQTVGFVDSAWPVSTHYANAQVGGPIAGTDAVWTHTASSSKGEASLFRRKFLLPPGEVVTAVLQVKADNIVQQVYVNGTAFGGADPIATLPATASLDVASALLPGAVNVIAIRARELTSAENGGSAGDTWLSYRLDVNGGT